MKLSKIEIKLMLRAIEFSQGETETSMLDLSAEFPIVKLYKKLQLAYLEK